MVEIVVIACLVVLGWLGFLFYRSRGRGSARAASPATPGIEGVRPGAVLSLRRVGPEIKDFDVRIVGRHRYREGGFEWIELEGEAADGTVWIEVERDDELSVSIALRRLALKDIGLEPATLEAFVKADDGRVQMDGKTYEYEDHGRAEFLRDGDASRAEPVSYWDFEHADGGHYLAVERWGEDDYQVHLSEALAPGQIEVFSPGEKDHESR